MLHASPTLRVQMSPQRVTSEPHSVTIWVCRNWWYTAATVRQPVKVKVKVTLVQALRLCTGHTAHRASRGIALPFLDHGTRRECWFSVTPRPLFTPGKTRYPLYRRLGGPQGQSGQARKISPLPGFDLRTVQPVVGCYTDYATRPTRHPMDDAKYLPLWCLLCSSPAASGLSHPDHSACQQWNTHGDKTGNVRTVT